MFGSRRHRPHPPPLTSATANPNAATAAAAVFGRNRETSPSLSAAAAAAALRALPTPPTNVAEVQTKRTMRRNASVSSSNSVPDLLHRQPGLQRRGSSGSMAERTFRSPSPHRPLTSGSGHPQSQSQSYTSTTDMPPVPALPTDVDAGGILPATSTSQESRRTTSLGLKTTPLRVASQRLGKAGAPSWFSAANVGDTGNMRRTDPAMASPPSSPPQPQVEELGQDAHRPSSRSSSINFSYPARVRVGSPPVSPVDHRGSLEFPRQPSQSQVPGKAASQQTAQSRQPRRVSSDISNAQGRPQPAIVAVTSGQALVYDPNSRRMVPRASLAAIERVVLEASEKPAQPKKKKQTPTRAGSHLAQGTMGRSEATTSAMQHPREPRDPVVEPPVRYQGRASTTGEIYQYPYEPAVKALIPSSRIGTEANKVGQQHGQEEPSQENTIETESLSIPRLRESMRSPPSMRRQPSVVKEEPEPEVQPRYDPDISHGLSISEAIDAVPSRQKLHSALSTSPQYSASQVQKLVPKAPSPPAQLAELPAEASPDSEVVGRFETSEKDEHKVVTFRPLSTLGGKPDRTQSASPVRQAHFGSVSEGLAVKHSPPPRSISPRKSALKQHSPSRGASPSDDTSETSAGVHPHDEQSAARRKSVRVSFSDESNVVVGESPVVPSTHNASGNRHWYSLGRNKKKDLVPLDDDELMKPRPALPSFGSVRDKKPRDLGPAVEERPLVRPMLEATNSPPLPATPTLLPTDIATSEPGLVGQSNDHAIGAILQQEQDQTSKNPANISRFREPLPPVVTSIEGSGYLSDSSEGSDISEQHPTAEDSVTLKPDPSGPEAITDSRPQTSPDPGYGGPNPNLVERNQEQGKTMDGTVPTISITHATPPPKSLRTPNQQLGVPGGFPDDESDVSCAGTSRSATPSNAEIQPGQRGRAAIHSTTQGTKIQATGHTPATVVTSEAAAVESSDSESSIYSDAYEDLSDMEGDGFQSLDAVLETPMDHPAQPVHSIQKLEPELSAASTIVANPQASAVDDWENAKAYWRSLTADKRAQLEKEAREDAAVEADLEEPEQMVKPKKKKSVERRNSERRALAAYVAQQQGELESNNDRSYMIKPGTQWSEAHMASAPIMRTSMRSPASQVQTQGLSEATSDGQPRLRKSMRPSGSTTRSAEPLQAKTRPSLSQTERPMSFPPPRPTAPVAGARGEHKTRRTSEIGPSTSGAPAAGAVSRYYPPLSTVTQIKRRGSDSSESSFRRMRSSLAGQGFGFRRSMRQPSPTSPPPEGNASNKFLRALSPSGSPFRKPPPTEALAPVSHMRKTLRDQPAETKTGGIRIPSFGLSSGGGKRSGKRTSTHRSRGSTFASRFGDSSDDDDGPTSGFRSRFEDSSDEDGAAIAPLTVPATKRSGKPASFGHRRNQVSNASTALPEEQESDELPDNGDEKYTIGHAEKLAISATTIQRSGSGRGTLANPQSPPMVVTDGRHTASKRGSIIDALRRKKPDTRSKISRPEMMDSAARRDTKLERSAGKLRGIRSSAVGEEGDKYLDDEPELHVSSNPQPSSPKLQKRVASFPEAAVGTRPALGDQKELVTGGDLYSDRTFVRGAGLGITTDEKDPIEVLRRPSTSGNLGTRTLSGYSGSGAQPVFLQQRTVSTGVLSMDAGIGESPKKKKKFGALRKMFRLD